MSLRFQMKTHPGKSGLSLGETPAFPRWAVVFVFTVLWKTIVQLVEIKVIKNKQRQYCILISLAVWKLGLLSRILAFIVKIS